MTTNSMDAAIAAAQKLAAETPATSVAAATATALAPTAAPVTGTPMTMESMSAGSLAVDNWLKVSEDGFKIGDASGLIAQKLRVTLDMTENKGFQVALSAKAGNPARYIKTTDGVTEATTGQPWQTELANLRLLDAKVRPYNSVTVAVVVDADILDIKGVVAAKAGTILGFTTSTTNWNEWFGFYQKVKAAGELNQVVLVDLFAIAKTNKNGNNWGIIGFEHLGLAASGE